MAANKGSILIVDDSPTVRAIFQDYLESAGYRVREAENGHQGLDLLREQSFDLVLSDMEMPEIRGAEFRHGLLVSRYDKALSRFGRGKDLRKALFQGLDRYGFHR